MNPPTSSKEHKVSLFYPLVVSVMVGSIAWSLVALLHLIAPDWDGRVLILGCVLAAVEAGYSHQLLRSQRRFREDVMKFRAVELVMLFILIKIGGYTGESWAAVWADIQSWPQHPASIFDLETMAAYALALMAWLAATATAGDLGRLGEPPLRSREYVSPLDSLGQRFFWGGGILLVIAGLALAGRVVATDSGQSLATVLRGIPNSPSLEFGFSALLYFLLGLLILGQVRLTLMRIQWQDQDIPVDETLPGRWRRATLLLVVLAAVLASLLPASTPAAAKLFEWVGAALTWLAAIVVYIVGLILFVVTGLFGLLLSFFIRPTDATPTPAAPPRFEPPLALTERTVGVTPEWVLLMRSVLFWTLIAAGVLFVVRIYLRDHPELTGWLSRLRPVSALRHLWEFLQLWFTQLRGAVQSRLPRPKVRRPAEKGKTRKPFRFFRLGALSARKRILYYYWSILRRAERSDYPRRPPETPYEYHASLRSHLPQVEDEMGKLTEAFLEARYSEHPVESGRDKQVRTSWQGVKAALRRKREPDDDSE